MIGQAADAGEDCRLTNADGILTVTFTRDKKLNAITPAMLGVLQTAVDAMQSRDDLRVLVIAAEGRYFSAGIDIATLDPDPGLTGSGERSGQKLRANLMRLHHLLDSIERLEKPVVHAAHAPCLGLGLELAVSCDFRLAAQSATYSLPEIPKMGVLAGSGGISRLTRLVGPHWARWISMLSRPVSAAHALNMGLVHEVHADADFAEAVKAFARELADLPMEAVALAKLAINASASTDPATARDFERVANTLLILSERNLTTVAAYREKSAKPG